MNTLVLSLPLGLALLQKCVAIPPYPLKSRIEVKGPDGSDMPIFLTGDAWSERYETEDGYTVVKDPDNGDHWVYLREDRDFTWKNSMQPPQQKHLIPKRTLDRIKRVQLAKRVITDELSTANQGWRLGASPSTLASGQRSVLVVALNFQDSKLALDEEAYWRMTFGEAGSLKSFYERSSYGKLNIVPARETCGSKSDDGVAIVDVPQTQPVADTTEDDGVGNNFTTEAMKMLIPCVDFASYDRNTDGLLTPDELSIVFILPGREGAIACSEDKCHKTWAKYRYFGPLNQLYINDKRITSATYIAELGDCECTQQNHYGVLCHEFAHSLGLQSLSVGDREDDTTLMKTGGWCTPDPCDFDPWSKAYLGWVLPHSIPSDSTDVDAEITERGTSPETDIIEITYSDSEELLVEKRPGELGPSVWQVKYSKEAPIIRLIARDTPRWSRALQSPKSTRTSTKAGVNGDIMNTKDNIGLSCINFEVRGSSKLGKVLHLHFNNPKMHCGTSSASSSNDPSVLSIETDSVVNVTEMFGTKSSLLMTEFAHRRASHTSLKTVRVPKPFPLLDTRGKKKETNKRLPTRATSSLSEESSESAESSDSSCCNCGSDGGCKSNCNNGCCCSCSCSCCCCCCRCGGCKSGDKCSKYENKADYYWKCDDTKCIPYNDEDEAAIPDECFYDSSSVSTSRQSSSFSSTVLHDESSVLNDESDNSEDSDDSEEEETSSDENVMTCSSFTYELPQGRNCASSADKSSLFEESSQVRRSSSRSSLSSSGSGGRNGMRKNSAARLHGGVFSILLFFARFLLLG